MHVCVRERSSMHMQMIAVGVTNIFRGPFWTALKHVRTFSFDF